MNLPQSQSPAVIPYKRRIGCWLLPLAWLGLAALCGKATLGFVTNEVGLNSGNFEPAWSPNGRQIAFVSDRELSPAIYVMNADGSGQRRLTYGSSDDEGPAWSPDSQRIAFSRIVFRDSNIYVMNADGSALTPLYRAYGNYSVTPPWSPDGRQIAFIKYDLKNNSAIYVMNAD